MRKKTMSLKEEVDLKAEFIFPNVVLFLISLCRISSELSSS